VETGDLLLGALLFLLGVAAAAIALSSMRVYKEHERGVRFRLGRLDRVLGPGIAFAFPYLDSTVVVDTRLRVLELEGLKAMAKGNATVFLGLVARYSISSPELAVTKVADAEASLRTAVEASARNAVGELSFTELVGKREFISARLRESVSSRAEGWGLAVEGVEITEVTPSERTLELINKSVGGKRRARR